jgi:AraC-like DNA-binding protein
MQASFYRFAFRSHFHDTFAIGVIEHGSQRFFGRGCSDIVPSRGIYTINPGTVHAGAPANTHGWHYLMAYIDRKIVDDVATGIWGSRNGSFSFNAPVTYDDRLAGELLSTLKILASQECNAVETQSILYATLSKLLIRHGDIRTARRRVPADHPRVHRACEFMYENAGRHITLADIAAEVGLSPYHFLRMFKGVVGLSPHVFLNQCRVERARAAIEENADLAEAALISGFSDQSHMSRRFKEIYGTSPGRYRQNLFQ